MTKAELLGLKKAAIVLKAVADSMKEPGAKVECMTLVQCIIAAANLIEEKALTNG